MLSAQGTYDFVIVGKKYDEATSKYLTGFATISESKYQGGTTGWCDDEEIYHQFVVGDVVEMSMALVWKEDGAITAVYGPPVLKRRSNPK